MSFFKSQDPHPHARRSKKNYLHPSLVFATIIIIKEKEQPKSIPSQPSRAKSRNRRPLYVWSAVAHEPEFQKRQTTNKTPLRQMFINKHAPIPFTREQWQPRYLPSFLSNSNKAPRHQARASHIARACHHKRFFSEENQTFSRTNTKSHFNPYSSAIKTPSSMLPNIDIL